jgi:hypothetical protein
MAPLVRISEAFREDVSGLPIGLLVEHDHVITVSDFMEKIHNNAVSAEEVPHGWVPPRFTHAYHGLVVLVEVERNVAAKDHRPQVESGKP